MRDSLGRLLVFTALCLAAPAARAESPLAEMAEFFSAELQLADLVGTACMNDPDVIAERAQQVQSKKDAAANSPTINNALAMPDTATPKVNLWKNILNNRISFAIGWQVYYENHPLALYRDFYIELTKEVADGLATERQRLDSGSSMAPFLAAKAKVSYARSCALSSYGKALDELGEPCPDFGVVSYWEGDGDGEFDSALWGAGEVWDAHKAVEDLVEEVKAASDPIWQRLADEGLTTLPPP